jgi:hypothetical protein
MTSIDTQVTRPTRLADLVGDVPAFHADVHGRRPATFHCGVDTDFLAPADLWAMLDRGLLVHPYFRVERAGVRVPVADVAVTRSVQKKPLPAYADAAAVAAHFADGHTVVLDEAGHWHAGVKALLAGLREDLDAEVHAAAVLTPPGGAIVVDGQAFVVQLAGQSTGDVVVSPGEVRYLPAGSRATAVGESLQLVVTVTPPTARDIALLALAGFLKSEHVERIAGNHHALTPAEKVAWLRTALAAYLSDVDVVALAGRAARSRQRGGQV